MNEYEKYEAVSDWGCKLDEADKSQDRFCIYMRTENCSDTRVLSGMVNRMARFVVGFTKHASYSDAAQSSLAVIARCPGCNELFWYHIPLSMVEGFVEHCPAWPTEQKEKFKS